MSTIWTFYGYVTPGGNHDVQEWFNELEPDAQDEVIDTLGYLQVQPIHLWKKPEFYRLGDGLSEVRCKVNELNKTIRMYGFFWPEGQVPSYSILSGTEKKTKNPSDDISEARTRKKRVEKKVARVYGLDFKKSGD